MRIKLVISYDGTNYRGFQRQKNGVSIQEELEKAIECVTKEKTTVTASGRTDAGVHAEGQVVHFDTNSTVPPIKFYKALNPHLPSDIKALSSCEVEDSFNARKSAKKKTYKYIFYFAETELPLKDRYAVRLEVEPNFELIKECAKLFVGEHDFKAFSSTGSSVKTTVRTVYSVEMERLRDGFAVSVTGSGFLYNMVRIMVGAILDVGYGKKSLQDIEQAFVNGKRETLGKTLPAKGLCLQKVEY